MENCSGLTDDILNNCDNEFVGGGSENLILFNYRDILDYDVNVDNGQIIEGIDLTTSPQAKGYLIQGFKQSVEETRSVVANPFKNYYNHQFVFRVFGNTPEVKKQIEGLANGRFVAIYENNYKGVDGNAAFELYGKVQGLVCTVMEAAKNDADSQGAYVITLSTPDNNKEPNLPATVYVGGSYTATKAFVESLTA